MKALVIAEKPSVAGDIARALGGMKRQKDFYESESYVVSSAIGHLLEIRAPEKFEAKRGKWKLDNLPVLPDYFELTPMASSEPRLRVLRKLYERADVGEMVNACDAGREGELIFYNIMRYLRGDDGSGKTAKKTKTLLVRRLWLSSMTPAAIRSGFDKLRADADMQPLRHAAVCRAEADWLVGINSTRAMTALHSTGGGFTLTTVGRVQTPTLAILVDRESQISTFKPRDYWEVRAQFAAASGLYEGLWNDPKVGKDKERDEKPERIFSEAVAKEIVAACDGGEGVVEERKKPQSEVPPLLFDLTLLQREANSRFGLPARATLSAAQVLYERLKMITYPRTDSKALPEDYPQVVRKTLSALQTHAEFGAAAAKILKNNWVVGGNKRIFNNAKISDHFAIVPTGEQSSGKMNDIEAKVYRLILMRFLSIFFPSAKYEVTERRTTVSEHLFLTRGRVMTETGWREVAGRPRDAELVAVKAGERVRTDSLSAEQKRTQPLPRYNEATLLSAMEGAGKFVDDEALREAMRERGMGTPATRASIIEGLLKERYVVRDMRELIPTPKAQSLLRLLRALKVEDLTLPTMTGEWEYKLRRMERADFDHEAFMEEIRLLTRRIVEAAQGCGEVDSVAGEYAVLRGRCLDCGGEVRESHRRFSCVACDFFVWKAVAGREFSVAEIEILLNSERTPELDGFRNKMGREFSAMVTLKKDAESGKWRTTFDFEGERIELSAADLQSRARVGACPKCGAAVRDTEGGGYICENKISAACDFSMPHRLLQREMRAAEIENLLQSGRTALLLGFISRKNRRPFKAHLIMDLSSKEGKLGWEFAPRPVKGAVKSTVKGAVKSAPKKAATKKPVKTATKTAAKKAAKKAVAKSATKRAA